MLETAGSLDTSLASVEKNHIEVTLARHAGNRTHAALALGISVRTLQRKIRDWKILAERQNSIVQKDCESVIPD